MIDEEEWMDINALHRQGHTYAEIARMVGRDWRTVKRYLEEGVQPVYRRRKQAPSMLDPFKAVVDGWLRKEPNLRATRIHQDLVRDYGFTGGYQIVQRHLRDLRATRDQVRSGYEDRRAGGAGFGRPRARGPLRAHGAAAGLLRARPAR